MIRRLLLTFAISLVAAPSLAACDCHDTNADGYPDEGGTCTGTSVTMTSPRSTATKTVTFGTYSGDATYTCGQYLNGDYWVVAKGSPARFKVASYLPAFGSGQHGWQINPVRIIGGGNHTNDWSRQNLDDQPPAYVAPTDISLEEFEAEETILFGVSYRKSDGTCGDNPKPQTCIRAVFPLTVVAAAPANPHLTFRPPYGGKVDPSAASGQGAIVAWTKPVYTTASIDWSKWVQRPCSGCAPRTVSYLRDLYKMLWYDPLEHANSQTLRPLDALQSDPYGGDWAHESPAHYLMLLQQISNPATDATGRQAILNYIQRGIDAIHMTVEGDHVWWGGGSHGNGGRTLAWAAAYWLNSAGANAINLGNDNPALTTFMTGDTSTYFSEQQQYYRSDNGRTYSDLPGFDCDTTTYFTSGCAGQFTLFGQRWGNPRDDNNTTRNGGNDYENGIAGTDDASQRDPFHEVDGATGFCNWAGVNQTGDYERINHCAIMGASLVPRLHEEGNAVWDDDNVLYEFTRRMQDWGRIFDDQGPYPKTIGAVTVTAARCPTSHGTQPRFDDSPRCYRSNNNAEMKQLFSMWDLYKDVDPGTGGSGPPSNVPPTITLSGTLTVNEGSSGNAWSGSTTDADAQPSPRSCSVKAQPANGSATVTADCSSGTVSGTYTPNAGYNGSDAFVIEVTDGQDVASATKAVSVTAINSPPVAGDVGTPTWHAASQTSRFIGEIKAAYQLGATHVALLRFSGNSPVNFSVADSAGLSLRFYDQATGTLLDHCIQQWNPTLRRGGVFVEIPTGTVLLGIYYGGQATDVQQCDSDTFGSYDAFWSWHLNDTTPTDLSGNARDLVSPGGSATTPSIVASDEGGLVARWGALETNALQFTAVDRAAYTIEGMLNGTPDTDPTSTLGRLIQFTPAQSFVLLTDDQQGTKTAQLRSDWNTTDAQWIVAGEGEPVEYLLVGGEWRYFAAAYDGASVSNDPDIYPDTDAAATLTTDTAPAGTRTSLAGTAVIGNRSALDRVLTADIQWLGLLASKKSAAHMAAQRAAYAGTLMTEQIGAAGWVFSSGAIGLGNAQLSEHSSDPEGDTMSCALAGTPNYVGAWGSAAVSVNANCSWVTTGAALADGEYSFDFTVTATGGSDTATATFLVGTSQASSASRGSTAGGALGVGH